MTQLIPLTKGQFTRVDDQDYSYLYQWCWRLNSKGYAIRSETMNGKEVVYCMHRIILGAGRGRYVDHIDNDRLNNVRSNLRLCTQSENQANRRLHKNSSSGYKGVTRHENYWNARIWVNGRCVHLGYHSDPHTASMIYDHAARRFYGVYAKLNHPDVPISPYYEALLDSVLTGTQPRHSRCTRASASLVQSSGDMEPKHVKLLAEP